MDPLALAAQIVEAGWAVAFVLTVIVGATAVVKGWIVPRFVYDKEAGQVSGLTAELGENTKAIRELAEEIRRGRA